MNEKQKIYDEMCRVLTEWETQEAVDDDLYWMLVKIQNNWETVITANTEDSSMSRIDNIKKFAQKREEDNIAKEKAITNQIEEYKEKIKSLKPRIDELISVANACLENGIEINAEHKSFSTYLDKWECGTFCTNGISHKIGFVWQYRNNKFINKIEAMGIDGGGANGEHYLRTDGSFVISRVGRGYDDKCKEPDLYQLKRFVETFDDFETAFYKYVDKITA